MDQDDGRFGTRELCASLAAKALELTNSNHNFMGAPSSRRIIKPRSQRRQPTGGSPLVQRRFGQQVAVVGLADLLLLRLESRGGAKCARASALIIFNQTKNNLGLQIYFQAATATDLTSCIPRHLSGWDPQTRPGQEMGAFPGRAANLHLFAPVAFAGGPACLDEGPWQWQAGW